MYSDTEKAYAIAEEIEKESGYGLKENTTKEIINLLINRSLLIKQTLQYVKNCIMKTNIHVWSDKQGILWNRIEQVMDGMQDVVKIEVSTYIEIYIYIFL